jgi:hypothetical protein
MGSHAKKTMLAVTCGAMWLAGCGGGEGTPRPENGAGMGATGGTGAGTGGTGGSGAGTGGMPVDECPTRTPRTGGVITPVEEVGTADMEHRRFPANDGGWFIYHANPADNQCTEVCMTTPPRDGAGEFTLSPTMPARSGSTNALHVVSNDFPGSAYGGGIGVYLDCASLSEEITGVSFYYRSDRPLTFGVASGLPPVDHNTSIAAASDWTHAEIMFEDLAPATFNHAILGSMYWRVAAPAGGTDPWSFDIWLDDISWIGGS